MVVSTNITKNPSSCASGVLFGNYGLSKHCRQSLSKKRVNYLEIFFSAKTAKKNSNKQILTIVTFCEILSTATPLDKERPGRRIRQPQAVTHKENSMTIFPSTGFISRYSEPHLQVSGAWVGSQRKRPRCALSLGHCLAATRSAFSDYKEKALTML